MAEVEVIKAVEGPILRKRDYEGKPLVITRQRVAAYVRVSTDGDEQLESFQSQKQYYQDKISENRDWVMVGIYADEAITGTKVDKGHRGRDKRRWHSRSLQADFCYEREWEQCCS